MKKIKDLNIEELQEIVTRVKVLRFKGHSYRKITEIISIEYGVELSKATVLRWCKNTHNPFNRIKTVPTTPSPELSYIIGVYLGDGSIHKKNNGRYLIKLKVIDKDFAEAFAEALRKLGISVTLRFERDKTRVNRFYVEGSNKTLFQLLQKSPDELMSLAEKYPREFLRGFFDSEGFPTVYPGKTFTVQVAAVNSDVATLKFAKKMLAEMKIRSRIVKLYSKGHKLTIRGKEYTSNVDMFILRISRFDDVLLFAEGVGFTANRKSEKLWKAIELKRNYPPIEAAERWLQEYTKAGRTYVKRGKPF